MKRTRKSTRFTSRLHAAVWLGLFPLFLTITWGCSNCESTQTACRLFVLGKDRNDCPNRDEAGPILMEGLSSRAELISVDSDAVSRTYEIGNDEVGYLSMLECCYKFTYKECP
jgi:hypothetical protein